MANPTLYQVLGLPPSATRSEIRAAYLTQIERVRTGELPRLLARSIERAYVTLDNPDSRVHYDVGLAASAQEAQPSLLEHLYVLWEGWLPRLRSEAARWRREPHNHALVSVRLPQWQPARWVEVAATVAALIAGLAVMVSTQPFHARRTVPPSLPVSAGYVSAPVAAVPPPSNPVTVEPSDAAVTAVPAPPETTSDAATPAPQSVSTVATRPVAAAVAPAPSRAAVAAPARSAPAARQAGTFERLPADTESDAPSVAATEPAVAEPQPQVAAAAPASPAAPSRTLVWSTLIWGTKLSTHVAGEYCRDRAGGEVFMPLGAPVPADLNC